MDIAAQHIHVEKSSHRIEVAGGILAGLYVLNLFDVVIFRPKENLSIHTNVIRDQIGLSFVYRY
jgi:predicted DNA-binding protein with PD1-like motif